MQNLVTRLNSEGKPVIIGHGSNEHPILLTPEQASALAEMTLLVATSIPPTTEAYFVHGDCYSVTKLIPIPDSTRYQCEGDSIITVPPKTWFYDEHGIVVKPVPRPKDGFPYDLEVVEIPYRCTFGFTSGPFVHHQCWKSAVDGHLHASDTVLPISELPMAGQGKCVTNCVAACDEPSEEEWKSFLFHWTYRSADSRQYVIDSCLKQLQSQIPERMPTGGTVFRFSFTTPLGETSMNSMAIMNDYFKSRDQNEEASCYCRLENGKLMVYLQVGGDPLLSSVYNQILPALATHAHIAPLASPAPHPTPSTSPTAPALSSASSSTKPPTLNELLDGARLGLGLSITSERGRATVSKPDASKRSLSPFSEKMQRHRS